MSAPVSSAAPASTGRRGGARLALVAGLVAVVVIVYLTSRSETMPRFSVASSAPHGYRAIALLAEGHGATVVATEADRIDGFDVVVVPVPGRLSEAELDRLTDAAAAGATVLRGNADGAFDGVGVMDRAMAELPAVPVSTGRCDIAELADLGPIDAALAVGSPVGPGERGCYGDELDSIVVSRAVGEGRIVTLGAPSLLSNARLQPAKEDGGEPLANATMALRLFARGDGSLDGVRVGVVEASGTPGSATGGTQDPIQLLPLPVKLALVQGAVALVLYLWWRGRRLGRPVAEPLPVQIAASELVDAIGDLHRRRRSSARAATVMRTDVRRDLSLRLGLPPGSSPSVLVERVAARTGRSPQLVHDVLVGPSVPRDEDLVHLANSLDSIRQEVLDDQPAP